MLKNFIFFFKKLIKIITKNKSKWNLKKKLYIYLKNKKINKEKKYKLYKNYLKNYKYIYRFNRYKCIISFLKSIKISVWKYLGNINYLYWLNNRIHKLKKRRFFYKSKRKKLKEKNNYIYIKRRKWIYFPRKRKYIKSYDNLLKKKQISLKRFYIKLIKNKKNLKIILKTIIIYLIKINYLNLIYNLYKYLKKKLILYNYKLIFIKKIITNIYIILLNMYCYKYLYCKNLKYLFFFIKNKMFIYNIDTIKYIILFYYKKKLLILYNLNKFKYFYNKDIKNYKFNNNFILKFILKNNIIYNNIIYNNKISNNNNILSNIKKNKFLFYNFFNVFFDWKHMFLIKLKFSELRFLHYTIYLKNLIKLPIYEYSLESSRIIPKNILNDFLPKMYNFYIWRYYNIKKINEFIVIIMLTAFLKISKFFCIYIRNILKKILLKYHKNFFLFFFSIIKNFIWYYRKYFGIKGIVLEFRGKLAKGGNTRKKLMHCKYGEYSYSNKNLKMTFDKWDIWSSTGAIGCFFKLFFY